MFIAMLNPANMVVINAPNLKVLEILVDVRRVPPFLAHLSRRLKGELIVYPCSGVPPGGGRKAALVLVQISSELWFPLQQIAPIEL